MKLSDALVLEARLTGELAERSIAGQVEFWARLGRAIEPLLEGEKVLALRKSGDVRPLSELLSSTDSPEGRRRVVDHLAEQPFPHYEAIPDRPGLLIRTEEDGTRTVGRFVHRQFEPVTTTGSTVQATSKRAKATERPGTGER